MQSATVLIDNIDNANFPVNTIKALIEYNYMNQEISFSKYEYRKT